jgi:hypothetical protein
MRGPLKLGCVAALVAACNPPQLPPEYLVSETRILAIRAEPAEIGPGETTTLRALIGNPRREPLTTLWFPCISDGGFGCSGLDFEGGGSTVPVLGESFTWSAEGDSFDPLWEGLGDAGRIEGLAVSMNLVVLREDPVVLQTALLEALNQGEDAAAALFEQYLGDALIGLKRVQVSEPSLATVEAVDCDGVTAIERNRNPRPRGTDWHFDQDEEERLWFPWPEEALVVQPTDLLLLRSRLFPADVESYLFVTPEGRSECRREEPYFAWLTEAGSLSNSYSFPPRRNPLGQQQAVRWRPPPAERWPLLERIRTWYVVRDRRGGVAWSPMWFRFGPNLDGPSEQLQPLARAEPVPAEERALELPRSLARRILATLESSAPDHVEP